MYKTALVSLQALLVLCVVGQCISAPFPFGYGIGLPYRFGAASLAASNGNGVIVTSASPMAPNGVSVLSENVIEGPLAVRGALPFLGTVALEGALPTAGAGSVNYGCGNGAVGMIAEEAAPMAYAPFAYGFI